ncbi:MAG: DUF3011 domain-containing protein [Bryobacteraceae bacterium]
MTETGRFGNFSAIGFVWLRMAAASLAFVLCLPLVLDAQGGFQGEGQYEIANVHSGLVIDLDRNDQTTVIQYSARNTANQVWVVTEAGGNYYYIRNAMNGYALEAPVNRNSEAVRGVPYSGGDRQQWRIESGKDGNALIINRHGKSLDISGSTRREGARVQIYDANGEANQRFIFRAASGNYGGSWRGGGSAQSITCSSNSGKRVYCGADTSNGVRMVRQISGSPCREGETWGYDSNGIWVDRGCRAEFETMSRSSRRGRMTSSVGTITCSSNSGDRERCAADTRNGVRMVRQISGSPCREGETWGYDSNGIWVDRGCRAEFEIMSRSSRRGRTSSSVRTITCSSNSGDRERCAVDTRYGVRMVRQISGSPCRQGETWGYDSNGIWVDRGCRAEFEVGR